jgi:5-methylcytosine-specific restriction endonuclease McrA
MLDGDSVNFRSSRLATFRHSLRCVCCGLTGSFFVKEKHRLNKNLTLLPFHLNLYAIDHRGYEVLMTSDHIIPRSKAPPNLTNNRQTMCVRCNHAKGNRNISISKLRKEMFNHLPLLPNEDVIEIREEMCDAPRMAVCSPI